MGQIIYQFENNSVTGAKIESRISKQLNKLVKLIVLSLFQLGLGTLREINCIPMPYTPCDCLFVYKRHISLMR